MSNEKQQKGLAEQVKGLAEQVKATPVGAAVIPPEPADPMGKIKSVTVRDGILRGARSIHTIEIRRPEDKKQMSLSGETRLVVDALGWHPAGVLVTHKGDEFVIPVDRIDCIDLVKKPVA